MRLWYSKGFLAKKYTHIKSRSKEEISRLVEETTVVVEFVNSDGKELEQALYPEMP